MIREIEYERPSLYAKQEASVYHDKRYGLVEASTKAGKTHSHLVWLLELAVFGEANQNYWWVAPVYNQAKIAYRRMKLAIPRNLREAHETDLRITLINGAHIWFKSAEKPDNLYGDDVHAAVLDEASRMREEAYHAVRSTLTATRGKMRMIGNVKGRKNFFYQLCRKAEAGEPDMQYTKLTAYDAVEGGVLELEEVEDAKRQLPEIVFKELYLAEPADDGGNPFGVRHIALCVAPLSTSPPVCYGVDLAKSYDWTAIIGLDAYGAVCRYERFQKPWNETKSYIKSYVGSVPCLVDSTGVGDPVLEGLQENQGNNFEGFKFNSGSKQQLMEGLALAITSGLVRFPDNEIRKELEEFEYKYTRTGVQYSAPEGMHDDCVCALALAVSIKSKPIYQRPSIRSL